MISSTRKHTVRMRQFFVLRHIVLRHNHQWNIDFSFHGSIALPWTDAYTYTMTNSMHLYSQYKIVECDTILFNPTESVSDQYGRVQLHILHIPRELIYFNVRFLSLNTWTTPFPRAEQNANAKPYCTAKRSFEITCLLKPNLAKKCTCTKIRSKGQMTPAIYSTNGIVWAIHWVMGCTILIGCIHTCNWTNYCDYNARNGSYNRPHNRNSWVNRRCDWTITVRLVKHWCYIQYYHLMFC